MHVVLVVPGGVDRTGEDRVIPALLWLVERLASRHRVTVVALGQEPQDATWPLLGATVRNVRPPRQGARAVAPFRLAWYIVRAVRACGAGGRPDVVHGFWASVSGLVAALAGRRYRVPSIVSAAGGELVAMPEIGYGGAIGRGGRLIGRLAMSLPDRVTVSSGWMSEHVRAAGHRVDEIVPLGVDTELFTPDPPRVRVAGAPELVHVASRNLVKDPLLLLDAFALVRRIRPGTRLAMIGVDTLDGLVERRAAALGLADAIDIHGYVRPRDLPRHYRDALVHVLSSRHDAAPVAVLEAAACGVPTVGTRVGHVTDLAALVPPAAIDVPVGDAAALGAAIVGLLEDGERRGQLASAALAWAVDHDAGHTAREFERIYASLRSMRRAS